MQGKLYQSEIDSALEGVEHPAILTQGNYGFPDPVQDLIFIPLSVFTTGAKPRALRFKIILNGVHVYHGNYDLNLTKLSAIKNPASFLLPASGNTVIPKQVLSKVLCFSQRSIMGKLKGPPTLDLWYEERGLWHKGFRIIWSGWSILKDDFDKFGYVSSSENFVFDTKFTPTYNKDLLTK